MAFSSIFSSLNAIRDLAGAAINERDRQKVASIQVDLTEKIIQTQAQLGEVLGTVADQQRRISDLEQRIRELEAERSERSRYELAVVGTVRKFYAYRLRAAAELEERTDEVAHFVCQPCFELGKKVVLVGNDEGYWCCPVCKHGAQTEPRENVVISTRRRIRFDGY